MFYVYELIDPRDGAVFYVGKGKRGRIDQHEAEARKGKTSPKCDRIREIEAGGCNIIKRKASSHQDEQAAYDAEAMLICEYGLASLTNISPGGNGGAVSGPSLYEDRALVVQIAKLIHRMRGIDLSTITVLGSVIDFTFVPKMMDDSIIKVAKRRSLDWVNEVAARHRVVWQYQPAGNLA